MCQKQKAARQLIQLQLNNESKEILKLIEKMNLLIKKEDRYYG